MKTTVGILLLVATICTAVCAAVPRRSVMESSSESQLLWHDDEAFAFVGTGYLGANTSYAFYLLSRVSAFGAPRQDSRRTTIVFRMTSDKVEEHRLDGPPPPWLIAADGYVSRYDARWIGGRFEPYVPRKIPEDFAKNPPQAFSNVEGWSKRTFMVSYGEERQAVDFQLRGRPARFVISVDANLRTIDLERADMPVTRLMTASNRPRHVSLEEYNQIFGK